MLELKKNLHIKNNFDKKVNTKSYINDKIKSRVRKIFKNKPYFLNPTFQEILKLNFQDSSTFSRKLDIRVTPNNVFCTLKNLLNNKTIKVGSSGKYKVKTSKKTLRFSSKIILNFFLEQIKYQIKSKKLLINITGPTRIRKAILEQVSKYITKTSTTINVNQQKCFNGCRPQKKRRKKQKGLRIFR